MRADSLLFLSLTLQVIAVVMDVFTDIDIFRDLQEICRKQGVAVYILLDQALLSQFLDMCMDLKVHPEQEKVCILVSLQSKIGPVYMAGGSSIPFTRGVAEALSKATCLMSHRREMTVKIQTLASPSCHAASCWWPEAALEAATFDCSASKL